jgi:hypothetical protein
LKHSFEEFRNDVGEALCDTAGDPGVGFPDPFAFTQILVYVQLYIVHH